ncbi:MAG TPA: D-alanyl-D-alanine carboxypeptidase [Blastocatellia bacterium]|nr:D-alanyl-D-alanine carboxypeptidase [Blastocatellia bacterium]
MPVSTPRLRTLWLLVALLLTVTLASIEPANASPKAKKAAARSKGKVSKSKSKTASRLSARRGGSRSKRLSARSARRGGRLYARGRGRRSRWKKRVVASVHGVGVHTFLSNSWTEQVGSPDKMSPASNSADPSTNPGAGDATVKPVSQPGVLTLPAASAPEDVTRPRLANADAPAEPPLNPLVAAYADSLAAFGFSADNQGFIVTTLKGEVLAEHNADRLFNPASVTKIATSLTAISRLGPDFKFRTSLYTDGTLDPATGILHGSLYVIGSGDPALFPENAMMIADKLNRSGIREVDGNLVVLGQFFFMFSASREASAKAFRAVLTPDTWSPQVKASYQRFLAIRAAEDREANRQAPALSGPPGLKITGQTITDPGVNTSKLSPLAVHTSLPLLRVLKGLNDFSNNWMATVIGNLVGGPDAVERFLKTEVGFKDDEVSFATSSGLGANAISPRGTITMLRKLIAYLGSKGLGPEEILPVAGVDGGTLEKRFNDAYRGSVVAKTGTLSSVSALAGVAYTRQRGPLLFVIYNHGGSAHRFRAAQDETIKKLITLYGGPAPVRYAANGPARVSERSVEQSAASRGSSNQR